MLYHLSPKKNQIAGYAIFEENILFFLNVKTLAFL
jgi:hypothetical protein